MKCYLASLLVLPLLLTACQSGDSEVIVDTPSTSVASEKNATKLSDATTPSSSANIDYMKSYVINDLEYGTETQMTVGADKRVLTSNGVPNHITGTFPNEGNPNSISIQEINYEFPIKPKLSGESKWARETGVGVNGVKFEPETNERFTCKNGKVYKVEAIQNLLDLGLDQNHAHVQPNGQYHYHGVPTALITKLENGKDLIHVGFAVDGFPMYHSKSAQYKSSYILNTDIREGESCSYSNPKQSITDMNLATTPDGTFVSDWRYVKGAGDLDECNGTIINGSYSYVITAEYPYLGRCLKGDFEEQKLPSRPRLSGQSRSDDGAKMPPPHTHPHSKPKD